MSGAIQINVSSDAMGRAVSSLRTVQRKFPQAVARALNRTLEGMRTDAVKETHKKYFMSAKAIRASISLKKAGAGARVEMVSRDNRHSLADYQLTPKTPRARKGAAVMGAVMRAGGLKALRSVFLVKRAGGKYFPYVRVGSAAGSGNPYRYKGIRSLIAPALPQIIKNRGTVKAMEMGAEERFMKRIDHEILRILGEL